MWRLIHFTLDSMRGLNGSGMVSLICITGVRVGTSVVEKAERTCDRLLFHTLLVVAVTVAVAAPSRRRGCGGDVNIRIGNEETGSGTLPISGSHNSMTEEETIGTGARTRLSSIPGPVAAPISFFEGGGGICKGLYVFS